MSVLKKIRIASGYTMTRIAAEVGIPVSTYAMLESGERSAAKDVADKLGKLLNVRSEDIFLPERFTVRECGDENAATRDTA